MSILLNLCWAILKILAALVVIALCVALFPLSAAVWAALAVFWGARKAWRRLRRTSPPAPAAPRRHRALAAIEREARLRLNVPVGHPEKITAELRPADEALLAELAATTWKHNEYVDIIRAYMGDPS